MKQGDNIFPRLFTLALDNKFNKLNRDKKGIKIDEQFFNHLRITDDIVLFSDNAKELQAMLTKFKIRSSEIGLSTVLNGDI